MMKERIGYRHGADVEEAGWTPNNGGPLLRGASCWREDLVHNSSVMEVLGTRVGGAAEREVAGMLTHPLYSTAPAWGEATRADPRQGLCQL
jgi:hypothetical protein